MLSEFAQFRAKAHQMLAGKEAELDRLKGRAKQSSPADGSALKELDGGCENGAISPALRNQQELEREKLQEHLNIDYVKNVFLKYLAYQASGEEKEAMTLEKVLFTVLRASDKDLEAVERARQRSAGGLLGYFYGPSATVPRPVQPRPADDFEALAPRKLNGALATQLPRHNAGGEAHRSFNINISQ